MNRLGIEFLWIYRKEALSLAYLFLIGMAFGAIWIFHDRTVDDKQLVLAFEENHEVFEVVIADVEEADEAIEITAEEQWKTNAVKVTSEVDDKIQISIVIDDLGLLRDNTLDIIELDAPLTLAFLPYARDLRDVTQYAKGRGHELMVHLPMEPKGNKNPGPHAMLSGVSDQAVLKELSFNLSQFEGYVGINNHMGSAFTEDSKGLDLILDEIHKKGLLVLDSLTSRKSLFAKMAEDKNIPNATRDVFLDNEQDVGYILNQLAELEDKARRRGSAVAIGHPYRQTIKALSVWLPTLEEKGIVIVPISHLVKRKYEKIYLADGIASGGQASSSR